MVDPLIYDQFIEAIPRNKSVGETLREYMESIVEEHEKEKNLIAPKHDAIRNLGNYTITTLDKYLPSWIENVDDYETQNKIQDSLTIEEQRSIYIKLNKTTQRWQMRMKKQ